MPDPLFPMHYSMGGSRARFYWLQFRYRHWTPGRWGPLFGHPLNPLPLPALHCTKRLIICDGRARLRAMSGGTFGEHSDSLRDTINHCADFFCAASAHFPRPNRTDGDDHGHGVSFSSGRQIHGFGDWGGFFLFPGKKGAWKMAKLSLAELSTGSWCAIPDGGSD